MGFSVLVLVCLLVYVSFRGIGLAILFCCFVIDFLSGEFCVLFVV